MLFAAPQSCSGSRSQRGRPPRAGRRRRGGRRCVRALVEHQVLVFRDQLGLEPRASRCPRRLLRGGRGAPGLPHGARPSDHQHLAKHARETDAHRHLAYRHDLSRAASAGVALACGRAPPLWWGHALRQHCRSLRRAPRACPERSSIPWTRSTTSPTGFATALRPPGAEKRLADALAQNPPAAPPRRSSPPPSEVASVCSSTDCSRRGSWTRRTQRATRSSTTCSTTSSNRSSPSAYAGAPEPW